MLVEQPAVKEQEPFVQAPQEVQLQAPNQSLPSPELEATSQESEFLMLSNTTQGSPDEAFKHLKRDEQN
jgi:hypothetical protein